MVDDKKRFTVKAVYDAGYLQGQSDARNEMNISLCPHCHCMTKTIGLKDLCGKCGMHKKDV